MGQWRYGADGGEYTVEEATLRDVIAQGKLSGDTRVTRLEDDTSHRVDVLFSPEYRSALAENARRRSEALVVERTAKKPFFGRNLLAFLVLAAGAYFAYNWWSYRISCSNLDVKRVASQLVKDKLLKLTSGDVTLVNIATIGQLDSGGSKCSADVEVTGGPSGTSYSSVSYSAGRQGDSISVIGRIER